MINILFTYVLTSDVILYFYIPCVDAVSICHLEYFTPLTLIIIIVKKSKEEDIFCIILISNTTCKLIFESLRNHRKTNNEKIKIVKNYNQM